MIGKFPKIIAFSLAIAFIALSYIKLKPNRSDYKNYSYKTPGPHTTSVELKNTSTSDFVYEQLHLPVSEQKQLGLINFDSIACSSFNRQEIAYLTFPDSELEKTTLNVLNLANFTGKVLLKSICMSGTHFYYLVDTPQVKSTSSLHISEIMAAGGGTGYDTFIISYNADSKETKTFLLEDAKPSDITPVNISSTAYFSYSQIAGKSGNHIYLYCQAGDGPISKMSLRSYNVVNNTIVEILACVEDRSIEQTSCYNKAGQKYF